MTEPEPDEADVDKLRQQRDALEGLFKQMLKVYGPDASKERAVLEAIGALERISIASLDLANKALVIVAERRSEVKP